MDLQLMKTFLTVLETGNYSNAAIHLYYAQSTITSHIQKLESAYAGIRLLERKGHLMITTVSGEVLKKYATQFIELYDKSKKEILNKDQKTLRIGTVDSLSTTYLPMVIRKIKIMDPDISIQLFNDKQETLYSMLKNNSLDMMSILDIEHQFNDFCYTKIRKENFVIAVYKDHTLANKAFICFDDIKNEKFILTEKGCNYRKFLLDKFATNNCTPKITMELGSIESIKKAILDKWGIGFLPCFLVNNSDSLIPLEFNNQKQTSIAKSFTRNGKCDFAFIEKPIKFASEYPNNKI
ncbi:LysR family transcriptional regulator [Clostridium estertheticum]|uniref:LysR family transcriptional regulator n=1 Tax=Clostridium estertheticum TaxID=238834 RepID=UPI001C7DBD1E|nr:LysR family transcriptional regulator [Clostridium estertheticum]MBX4270051.1 LysR family transcriptional regulator [Clostridium estertheticum]WLC80255.1 LysR family transcriptional regulator [Clostridium estertheticum]